MTNDFPRMLYHDDGRTKTVASEAEQELARAVGFGTEPSDVHRRVQSFVPENTLAKTPAQGSKPDDPFGLMTFADLIVARVLTEVAPAIVDQTILRLRTEFATPSDDTYHADAPDVPADTDKPRRGRPPKDRSAASSEMETTHG